MKILLSILILLLPVATFGGDAAHCRSVLEHGARNFISKMDFNTQKSYFYSKACNNQYSNASSDTKLGIEAILKNIPVGISFGSSDTTEQVNNWCNENEKKYSSLSLSSYNENLVYKPAIDAWRSCVQAYSSGLKVVTEISSDSRSLAFQLTNDTTDNKVILRGVSVSSNTIKCKAFTDKKTIDATQDIRIPLHPKQSITINCKRNSKIVVRDGQKIEIIPQGSLTFNTKLKNYQISMPESSVVSLTDKRANQIESDISIIKKEILNLGGKSCSWTKWVNKAPLNVTVSCPNGKYVRKIRMKHVTHKDWWTEDVRVECCGW